MSTSTLSVKVRLGSRRDVFGYRPVMIQVLYQRRRAAWTTPYRVSDEELDPYSGLLVSRGRSRRRREYLRAANETLADLCTRLRALGAQLQAEGAAFSARDLVQRYRQEADQRRILVFGRSQIEQLEREGRHGTASTYRTTLRRFSRYCGSSGPTFEELTVRMVQDFESHLYASGLQRNTVTFYLRVLRALYNKAVLSGIALGSASPFRSLSFREDKTSKLAVDKSLLRRLCRLEFSPGSELGQARDLFMFSFYARGMSFVDMAYLRYDQLAGDIICYRRHKSGQPLRIRILPELASIIERYRDPASPWVLPILRHSCGESPPQSGEAYGSLLHRRYKCALNRYLSQLERLSCRLGSERRLTFNVARHSWASLARCKGIPLAVISEGLGHTSEKTTRIYLDELDGTLVDRANETVSRL